MKIKYISPALPLLLLIAYFPNTGIAQQTLNQCRIISDSLERLVCYDNLVDGQTLNSQESLSNNIESPTLQARRTEGTPPSATAEAVDSNETQVEDFGLTEVKTTVDDKQELVSTVTQIKKTGPNRVRLTLNNGQIWSQTTAKRFSVRVGETVRIYESGWGSDFRLSVKNKYGYIQVKRSE